MQSICNDILSTLRGEKAQYPAKSTLTCDLYQLQHVLKTDKFLLNIKEKLLKIKLNMAVLCNNAGWLPLNNTFYVTCI